MIAPSPVIRNAATPGGPAGPTGPAGPAGPTGPTAPSAPVAPTGPTGPTGPGGPSGPGGPGVAAPLGLDTAPGSSSPKLIRSRNVTARFAASPRCPMMLSSDALIASTQARKLLTSVVGAGIGGVNGLRIGRVEIRRGIVVPSGGLGLAIRQSSILPASSPTGSTTPAHAPQFRPGGQTP